MLYVSYSNKTICVTWIRVLLETEEKDLQMKNSESHSLNISEICQEVY